MLMLFTCEHCGKRIQVDARMQGRKGRCSKCGQAMRIPRVDATQPPPLPTAAAARPVEDHHAHAHTPAHVEPPVPPADAAASPFRLSPPEARPEVGRTYFDVPPVLTEPEHVHHHLVDDEAPSSFELLVDDSEPADQALASPEVRRGLAELEEFQKDRGPYRMADDLDSRFFRWARGSRPAGWITTQWRKAVGLVLKVLRFIDDWAYLISVPFLILIIFAIAIGHRGLVHTGAVVVVLINFGRFWTDLMALLVRPFKEGPAHGVFFFFPPYGIYFMSKHWDAFKGILRRLATSCIPIIGVILAYAFIPFIDPEIQQAPNVPAKLHRAEEEIIKESQEGIEKARETLRDVKRKVQELEKRGLLPAGKPEP